MMELQPGEPGIFQSLEAMRLGALKEATDPIVRGAALELVATCGPKDDACRASRIYALVKSRMRYVPDPVNVEAFGLASFHLENIANTGQTQGDCDDGAVLVATMATAVGLESRYAVASFRSDRELHHVWAEVKLPQGWYPMDTFRSERLQLEPTRVEYVNVR
jgi:transglutaminase-like putative cysteine protease